MNISLDESKMMNTNLSEPEVLMMKVLDEHACVSDVIESLQNSELVDGFSNDNITFLALTQKGKMILDRILEEKTENENRQENDKRLEDIAKEMREIYPSGFKRDDLGLEAYPWRGSVNSLKERLRKFEKEFYEGRKLDKDDVVEATRRYVDRHKKKDPILMKEMRLLKYFIYKNGESDLLEYLETEAGEDTYDDANGMTIL